MKNPRIIIPLTDHETADEAIINYIIGRGMLTMLLTSHFKPNTWASESARISHIAELVTPLLLPNTTLSVSAHGSWDCFPTPPNVIESH
jgi:hypothetical protein